MKSSSSGFSLLELLVAIALGLVVVSTVLQGFAASSAAAGTNAAASEAETNGRYALEVLKREIRHAALNSLVWDNAQIVMTSSALAAKDHGCGPGFVTTADTGISGANDSNPYSGSCLKSGTDRSWVRGDILTLRRTALQQAAIYDNGAPYVRASYGRAQIFPGETTTVPPDAPEPYFDFRLVSDVYYINAFTQSATETPLVPALYRLTLSKGANPVMKPELVASNVEHLQLQYGVTDSAGNTRYYNADAVPRWADVKIVRIWLLIRESTPDRAIAPDEYQMGDITHKAQGTYRRRVLSTTIALRNQ